jgi:hypothetical protein
LNLAQELRHYRGFPLHLAAATDTLDINPHLTHGPEVDLLERGPNGYTPLMCAATYGRVAACRQLLDLGALPQDDREALAVARICRYHFDPSLAEKMIALGLESELREVSRHGPSAAPLRDFLRVISVRRAAVRALAGKSLQQG